ncbi:MAG: ABC transporter ATP-binding protein [Sporomusaceae bacterium]|nr:ABC transporter ATP-binding protein [Sporomusaceae bacterium]
MRVIIEDVHKSFSTRGQATVALEKINFAIEEKEFVVLVGPSGCGKSTLLNMVGGLLSPTSGKIYVEGLTVDRDPSIGIVFQEVGLFPWMTVSENVAFGLEAIKLPQAEQQKRVQYYTELVGLTNFSQAFPHQLSGGMRQRVGIARALAIQPDILLMDEPFSALDAQSRTLMQEELLRIWHQTQLSTLYVTHNIQEAVYLADRVIVLSRRPGRIVNTIPIDLPKFGRDDSQYMTAFNDYAEQIWQMIRKDAQDALQEGDE